MRTSEDCNNPFVVGRRIREVRFRPRFRVLLIPGPVYSIWVPRWDFSGVANRDYYPVVIPVRFHRSIIEEFRYIVLEGAQLIDRAHSFQ
jgi:hypothetical protein